MIVVDTNVIVSGLRSRNGAAFIILRAMVSGALEFAISPTLVMEYEEVLKRPGMLGAIPPFSHAQIDAVLDALCAQGTLTHRWFRFRPFLSDPKDDHVIECALAANARVIVTDDKGFRHSAVGAFGLKQVRARDFVQSRNFEEHTK